jgi:hypothetical protein
MEGRKLAETMNNSMEPRLPDFNIGVLGQKTPIQKNFFTNQTIELKPSS